jgi:hypothetical protein
MLSEVAVRAGELLAILAITGVVLLTIAAAGGLWLKRRLRLRARGASWAALVGRARRAAADQFRPRSPWWWSRPVPSRHWVAAAVARRRLRRAVAGAEYAVTQARKSGAPTGDLDGLCRRLRQAAADTDRSLALAGRATPPRARADHASAQAAELEKAAGLIQDAAAASATSMARPAVSSLADDVRREVTSLSAGLASAARSTRPSGLPGESG